MNPGKVIARKGFGLSTAAMTSLLMRGIRCGLLLLGTGIAMVSGAAAQQMTVPAASLPAGAVVQPLGAGNGADLRRHLSTLAANPNSLEALIGAGRAALATGDAEAALSFFGRADQISPRNGRVKAGMAASLANIGQAQPALSLFAEAIALGAPVVEVAQDRGLAYDMMGNPRLAQQDYTLALRHRDNPEVRRRMALSLAISGEREAALRLIDYQLRRNDRAAWRTQAFVLALTGDQAGANLTAQLTMPAGMSGAMAPFFARLPALTPAQKARAVHLGHFPNGGYAGAGGPAANVTADPGAVAMAMSGASTARQVRPQVNSAPQTTTRSPAQGSAPAPVSRRRPETVLDSSDRFGLRSRNQAVTRQPSSQPAQSQPAQPPPRAISRWEGASPTSLPPPGQIRPSVPPPSSLPIQGASSAPTPSPTAPPHPSAGSLHSQFGSAVQVAEIAPSPLSESPPTRAPSTMAAADSPPTSTPSFATIAPASPSSAPQISSPPSGARASSLADIAAIVQALAAEPSRTVSAQATPERQPQAQTPQPGPERRRVDSRAAQPNPSRHWVQIAGAANRAGLPREFIRLRSLAPAELSGRTAYTTPLRATNRLLVGPFPSQSEAQAFVNRLSRRNVAAFAWTSPAGQEIERLQTDR